jgi:hypothetical protein
LAGLWQSLDEDREKKRGVIHGKAKRKAEAKRKEEEADPCNQFPTLNVNMGNCAPNDRCMVWTKPGGDPPKGKGECKEKNSDLEKPRCLPEKWLPYLAKHFLHSEDTDSETICTKLDKYPLEKCKGILYSKYCHKKKIKKCAKNSKCQSGYCATEIPILNGSKEQCSKCNNGYEGCYYTDGNYPSKGSCTTNLNGDTIRPNTMKKACACLNTIEGRKQGKFDIRYCSGKKKN